MSGALRGLAGAGGADRPAERVVLSVKPSPWFVVLRSGGTVVFVLAIAFASRWALRYAGVAWAARAVEIGLALTLALVLWQTLEWASRSYLVTDRRIVRRAGVLRRDVADLPLRNVQHVTVHRSLAERLLGVGTVGIATAGTAWTEVLFVHVDEPEAVMKKVRAAMDGQGVEEPRTGPPRSDQNVEETKTSPPRHPKQTALSEHSGQGVEETKASPPQQPGDEVVIIGLVGGIGAGKSEVAKLMAEQGAVVIDSDKEAREALDRRDVQEQLRLWWGGEVVGPDGRVDRRAVAKIVFEFPEERERLERLVHPLVKSRRAELIVRARAAGAKFVVVDAPLLLEAAVDAECDVVVFVEAPYEQRLERVKTTRGWDEAELRRREAAQWPLDRKREASDEVVVNNGDRERLRERVGEVMRKAARAVRGDA